MRTCAIWLLTSRGFDDDSLHASSESSSNPLDVSSQIAHVLIGEAGGYRLHDVVRTGRTRSRRVVVELLDEIPALLAAQRRKFRGLHAQSVGTVARHARRNIAACIAAAIKLRTGLHRSGVEFLLGNFLAAEIGTEVRHVIRAKRRRHWRH